MKVLRAVLIIFIVAAAIVGFKWHSYVTNTDSPYDEVGIELNTRLPGPFNRWGCAKLKENFANMLPPYGCQADATGRTWR